MRARCGLRARSGSARSARPNGRVVVTAARRSEAAKRGDGCTHRQSLFDEPAFKEQPRGFGHHRLLWWRPRNCGGRARAARQAPRRAAARADGSNTWSREPAPATAAMARVSRTCTEHIAARTAGTRHAARAWSGETREEKRDSPDRRPAATAQRAPGRRGARATVTRAPSGQRPRAWFGLTASRLEKKRARDAQLVSGLCGLFRLQTLRLGASAARGAAGATLAWARRMAPELERHHCWWHVLARCFAAAWPRRRLRERARAAESNRGGASSLARMLP